MPTIGTTTLFGRRSRILVPSLAPEASESFFTHVSKGGEKICGERARAHARRFSRRFPKKRREDLRSSHRDRRSGRSRSCFINHPTISTRHRSTQDTHRQGTDRIPLTLYHSKHAYIIQSSRNGSTNLDWDYA